MSYIALTRFADLRDKKHIYGAGDEYPRPGYVPSPERISELASEHNRMGYPLIRDVDAPCSECDIARSPEMPIEAVSAKGEETIAEPQETAIKGRRGRQRG